MQETVLRLERMVHGGRALARLPGGRVVLLTGGIPGERVRARFAPRSGVLQGEVLDVLEPSSDRVDAPLHPGLDYGFIAYPRQLALKREVVADALGRALGVSLEVPEVVAAPAPWGYRAVVQAVVAPAGLGYRRPGSDEVVVLAEDPVALPAIDRLWRAWPALEPPGGIRELVLRGNDAGEVLAAFIATVPARALLPFAHELLAAGATGVHHAPFDPRGRFRGGSERLAGKRAIRQRYGDFEIDVTASSFAQPNPAAAGGLFAQLAAWAPGGRNALELFAGSGIIAMHLSARYERVTAVEIDRGSVARGQRDAARLGLDNLAFIRGDARRVVVPEGVDLIVVDPPRAGLSKEARAAIAGGPARQLLYVSCDVASWARDVAALKTAGFRLARFLPFDFFPQTHHVEILSQLVRD